MSVENQSLIPKHSIKSSPDFTALLKEIFVAIESALLSADYIAQHEVVASMSFNLLITHLNDAAVALSKIEHPNLSQIDAPLPPQPTIFPCEDAARDVVVKLEVGPEFAYRIARDGAGRCSIGVYKLIGHL